MTPQGAPTAPKTHAASDLDRILVVRYQKMQDPEAQQRLVSRHERLVWSIAWRYRGNGEPVEDLAQEGFIGLIRAIERYDASSPAKFSSYAAVKIAGSIEHYLRDRSGAIRQPGWVQEMQSRVRREGQKLAQTLGRQPSMAEIAEALGETVERIESVMETASVQNVASLDEPVAGMESDSPSLSDVIPDAAQCEESLRIDERMDLERAMTSLDQQQQQALRLCFFQDMTFEEAGGMMGMDRHRTRRLVNNAVRTLRKQLQAA
jgi:RNA polymerase sigma-B factor